MVIETFVDHESASYPACFSGWRCLICGGIIDPLILVHQAVQPEPMSRHARPRKRGHPLRPHRRWKVQHSAGTDGMMNT